jgi:hypothetical protein
MGADAASDGVILPARLGHDFLQRGAAGAEQHCLARGGVHGPVLQGDLLRLAVVPANSLSPDHVAFGQAGILPRSRSRIRQRMSLAAISRASLMLTTAPTGW